MRGKHEKISQKPKNFLKTLKRVLGYIGKYNVAILIIVLVLACSTILSIVSPKILGKATTRLSENIVQKMTIAKIKEVYNTLPGEFKNSLPQNPKVSDLQELGMFEGVDNTYIENVKNLHINDVVNVDFNYIGKIILTVLVLYLFSASLEMIAYRVMAYISQKVTYNLRKDIDEKLDKLPLKFFDKNTHGEILSRITNDVDNISTMLGQSLNQIVSSIFSIIGIIIMMFTISITLTGITILIIPISLIFISIIIKLSQKHFINQQVAMGKLNSIVEETYNYDLVVKAYNMQDTKINEFEKINEELYKSNKNAMFLSGLMMPIITTINNLGYVGICILGAKLVINKKMTIGDIQAFIQYTKQFTEPLAQSSNMMSMIQQTVASAERIFEILDEEEEKEEEKNYKTIPKVGGNIKIDNICFSYDKQTPLIENWSLEVKKGETVAIVGPTGAGKTTIVNLLMRFYDIDSGDILIDGVSIKEIKKKDVRKMFAMVLQDTWLFNDTIKENLKYAKPDATDEEIIAAAELAHADHFINTLPGRYEFVLNEDSSNISQGEKQLLTIARAALLNAPMLILDEATSNVDTRTELIIQKAMKKLMKGKTTFVIAHRLSTIKNADIILVMDKGRIVERGNHEELLKKNGKYAELYNSQFSEEEE